MANLPDSLPFSVNKKTAIVTGAGSGINYCFAQLLLANGCNVVIADLALRPEAQLLVEQYSEKSPTKPRAVFIKTDVVSWKQLSAMFEVADREFGDIDIVCPGAGIFEPHWSNFWHPPGTSRARDTPDGDRYALLDINITHPIRTTQLALQYFLSPHRRSRASPSNPKRIVHISSIAGQLAFVTTPLYFASKHAISALIYSLGSLEEKFGIRVNGVAPGIIKTPLYTEHPEKNKFLNDGEDEYATPEEVAEAMLALVQDGNLPGGTVLEVGKKSRRVVPLLENPGPPKAPGLTVSGIDKGAEEVYEWLAEPNWGVAKL